MSISVNITTVASWSNMYCASNILVILQCVYKDPKMAPVMRHAYKVDFKQS